MLISICTSIARCTLLSIAMLIMSAQAHAVEVASVHQAAQAPQLAIVARPVATTNTVTPVKQTSRSTAKRLARKAMTPIRATVVQLGRPLEWLNSARHYFWPTNAMLTTQHFYVAPSNARLLEVNVTPQSAFTLGNSAPPLTTRVKSLGEYELPSDHEVIAFNHASATELQVRMAEDWSMLYVLDRTNTDLNNYTVSVGFGLRHSF